MRVAVCGSVAWTDRETIIRELDRLLADHSTIAVLTGMADGADAIARDWAIDHDVELVAACLDPGEYPGPMHAYNEWLIELGPDLVVAFKDGADPTARQRGHEPGTEHLMRLAAEAGIAVHLIAGRPDDVRPSGT